MIEAHVYYTNDEDVTYYTHYNFGKYVATVHDGKGNLYIDPIILGEADTLEEAQALISMDADSYNLSITDEGIVMEDGHIELVT